jgi:hypothetical protein
MRHSFFDALLFVLVALALVVIAQTADAQVVLTVGPHGTYAWIQDAIDAAISGNDTEIRVEGQYTYVENLELDASFASGSLALLGGWDTTFTNRVYPPQNTIIDGNQAGRVIDVFGIGGSLVIDGFTLTNGLSPGGGGGVRIDPSGEAQVTLSNLRITGNTVSDAGGNSGGGLLVELFSTQHLEVLNCRIRGNSVVSTGGGVVGGGGLSIRAIGDSSFLVQGCEIDENTLQSAGQLFAAGVRVSLHDNAHGELLDNSIVQNSCVGSDAWVNGVFLELSQFSILNMARTAIGLTTTTGGDAAELRTSSADSSSLRVSDSIMGLGDDDGVLFDADHTSTVHLVNLTVVDSPGTGIVVNQYGSATMTLYNSISFGNLVDLVTSGSVGTGFNLIGVDPHFADPDGFDYQLGVGSPAENAGTNLPPGGLGLVDFNGNPRIVDGVVDIGCYEGIAPIFSDGFESGDTSFWSFSVP